MECRFLLIIFVFVLPEAARGDALLEFLGDDDLLLYLSVAFLGIAGLFLFGVVLTIVIVTIKIQKMKRGRNTYTRPRSPGGTVIANSMHDPPLPERHAYTNEPSKWEEYMPHEKNTRETSQVASKGDNHEYMDMYIVDADRMRLPRASLINGNKTSLEY